MPASSPPPNAVIPLSNLSLRREERGERREERGDLSILLTRFLASPPSSLLTAAVALRRRPPSQAARLSHLSLSSKCRLLDSLVMASIRRAMPPTPNHDRPPSFPNHHHAPFSITRPPSASAVGRIRRLFRWHHYSRRRCFLRFLLCFLLGLLGGFYRFYDLDDFALTPHDFQFTPINPLPPPPPPPPIADQRLEPRRRDLSEKTMEEESKFAVNESSPNKLLIIVTPTYNRALQAYFLTRLGQTLKLVPPPVLWIVVEIGSPSRETADILRRSGVMYRHLYYPKNRTRLKDRGVHQRNIALKHIRQHRLDGIVYFADDDNIYTLELFDHLREIRRFGTWPVAMLAQRKSKAILEGPVCKGSQVIGWHTNERSKQVRRFHVDMSGFAFNSTIIWDPQRWQRPYLIPVKQLDTVKEGFQETTFIQQIVEDETQMEGLPSGCSKVMNWHLHLEASNLPYPRGWQLSRNLDAIIPLK